MKNKLYKYLLHHKFMFICYMVAMPVDALLEVALAYALAYALAVAIDYANGGRLDKFGIYVVAFVSYAILWFIVSFFRCFVRYHILECASIELKNDLMKNIINISVQKFRKENTGTYLANLTTDIDIIRNSYFFELLSIYGQAIEFIIALIALFFTSSLIGLFVVILASIQLLIPLLFGKKITKLGTQFSKKQQAYVRNVKETLSAFLTARLYGIENQIILRHNNSCISMEKARSHSKIYNKLINDLSFLASNIMFLGVFLLGAVLAINGTITVGAIVAASQLMVHVTTPLNSISTDIAEYQASLEVAKNLENILSMSVVNNVGVRKCDFMEKIGLEDICFSYEGKEILHNVNVYFYRGGKYLITGSSGSGKSTLLSMLARQYKPDCGNITMDGVPIESIENTDFRNLVTLLPQEPYLFDLPLSDNVRLFQNYTDKEVEEALNKAGLGCYVSQLSEGIHANPGENAHDMSGGEKQRVNIARALIRNTPVLLLDECTSNLDPLTASEIERLIFSLDDVTVIYVSHNATQEAMKAATEVLHLENGYLKIKSLV